MKPTQQNQAQNCAGSTLTVVTGGAGAAVIADVTEVQDRYAEAIVRGNADLYDALEIHGVRDQLAGTGASDTCFEVDNENPQLFSVYVHSIDDDIDAVGDFSRYDHAEAYARELSVKYGWPFSNSVPDKHKKLQPLQ